MSIAKQVFRQRDFSGGEIDPEARRRDDAPLVRAGARQMSNKRIMPTGTCDRRPGRVALFVQSGRTDEVVMSDGSVYRLSFGTGTLTVRDIDGVELLAVSGMPWDASTVRNLCWDRYDNQVFITFTGMRPRVLTYDPTAEDWSLAFFAPQITSGGQKRTPFHRFSTKGITLAVSGTAGTVDLTFSAAVLTASHVGTYIRYHGRQILITDFTDSTHGEGDVQERLFAGSLLEFSVNPAAHFAVGEKVTGDESGAEGVVTSFPSGTEMIVARLSARGFLASEKIVGPTGSIDNISSDDTLDPPASTVWDEEIMCSLRGWPRSVTVDQNRLIFADWPQLPRGIAWSAADAPTDLYPGTNPDEGLFEFAPKAGRVYHVMPGQDEFVFTSQGIFYIPISETNPLTPGSVAFREITVDPVSSIRPAVMTEGIAFLDAGNTRVSAIRPTGQTARPYVYEALTDYHSHLITSPIAITAVTGIAVFPDRCLILLNDDGVAAVGRFDPNKQWIGWVPWTSAGEGLIEWVSSSSNAILFTTRYLYDAPVRMVERTTILAPMDCFVAYNDTPTALAPGVGQGPLWFLAGATVFVMDGELPIGLREVDEDGFIVAEEGEEFDGDDILAGLAWSEVFEPFIPNAQEGNSAKQTLRKRKVSKIAITARHSTGFTCENRTVHPWRGSDDRTLPPTTREETQFFKKAGRSLNPRIEVVKTVPGTFELIEFGAEVTV